jgi:hypothetical protein
MSSFNSVDLFSSGPHRFIVGPMGSQLIENTLVSPTSPGKQSIGSLDGDIIVRGRLIADSEEDLWALLDIIATQLTTPPTAGDLLDEHDHAFKSRAFVSFNMLAPFDRARQISVPYEARFTRFGTWA